MSFICNLEHSVKVSFNSVRINFLFFLPELEFIFKSAVKRVLAHPEWQRQVEDRRSGSKGMYMYMYKHAAVEV